MLGGTLMSVTKQTMLTLAKISEPLTSQQLRRRILLQLAERNGHA